MTLADVALIRAVNLLADRLAAIEARIGGGDESAWPDYLAAAVALAQIRPALMPGMEARPVTQEALARELGVTPRTVRRRRARAEGSAGAAKSGGVIRWRARSGSA